MFALKDDTKVYKVGIYTRLSREDEDTPQSESIQNQKDFLMQFVLNKGWELADIYVDDGFSGTNFERPAFIRMIKDAEDKKLNLIITKDLSRLGRDYIETGYYLEKYFPEHNLRYIAVNDNIDTFHDDSNNDMNPFRSVINDMYAKDISKKVRTAMDTKRKNGKFIGSFAPYGYMKSTDDKNKLIIDTDAAETVKRIFNLYLNGNGYNTIADILNKEAEPCPSIYKKAKNPKYKNGNAHIGLWTSETIGSILRNPTYTGDITQNKYRKVNYKSKKLKCLSRDNWITINNTHECIIDKIDFSAVQGMISQNTVYKDNNNRKVHILGGIVYCGDCGERMTFTKSSNGNVYCICSNYKRFKRCTRHSIKESDLLKYVINDLKKISSKVIDKDKLLNKVKVNNERCIFEDKENNINNRLEEIKKSIKQMYEDKLRGILSEEDFIDINKEFNKEKIKLSEELKIIKDKLHEKDEDNNKQEENLRLIESIINFNKPDKFTLSQLIKSIQIYENKKIVINYNFKCPV